MPLMDFNNDTSFPNNLSLVSLAKIVTDNLCGVRAFIERDELQFEASLPKFLDEKKDLHDVLQYRTVFFRVGSGSTLPPFPFLMFSSLSSVHLFLCFFVRLFSCFYVSMFLCSPVLLISRLSCPE